MCRGFGWLGVRDAGRACGGRRGGDPGAAQPLHVQRIPPCISSLFSNKKLARRRNDSNSDSVHECADSVIGPRPVWRRFRWKCGNRATLRTSLRLSQQSPNRVGGRLGGWMGMILNHLASVRRWCARLLRRGMLLWTPTSLPRPVRLRMRVSRILLPVPFEWRLIR